MGHNIEIATSNNLCISCGVCKGICPKSCISSIYIDGMYVPSVNSEICVNCGICLKVCPGIYKEYPRSIAAVDVMYGNYKRIFNAWCKNPKLRHVAASGGVVTTLIDSLLDNNRYDVAFVLDTYSTGVQMKTIPVDKLTKPSVWEESSVPKSRYLPVSHEYAIQYMREFPDLKMIFVGTSCAISGLKAAAQLLKRDIQQYLFIGLFCDSVFNYQIVNYFEETLCENRSIQSIHFKNKESGGWPGNIKLFYADGSSEYKNKSERENAKKYFMPERCLYCIDKLNINADISVGDNYTNQNSTILGSNSVIIRTEQGDMAWNLASKNLDYYEVAVEKLREAQYLDGRLNNLYFATLKERRVKKNSNNVIYLNKGIELVDRPIDYEQALDTALGSVMAGMKYSLFHKLVIPTKGRLRILLDKFYYATRRRLLKE